ncbi:hypothetical protein jhhlp_000591 [Lomentospora prolificans]|uniref:GRIP domain-containing protein n=1 Tax=Lomentospora prolificans TaxID=41688 RepID=A0A2N3NIX3_9PEZI|nr:hypothetical protein jhhlp_000591 [Lomentospora prolificans]
MFQSLQRIKGAIDRTIAEEQARSKEGTSSTPSRQSSTSSRGGKNESPSRRPRPKQRPSQDTSKSSGEAATNPDPAVFEAAFALDDSEDPSRAGTPKPPNEKDENVKASGSTVADEKPSENGALTPDGVQKTGAEPVEQDKADTPAPPVELPMEVRVKLRKFERLESTYTELLRSYRIAHSRAKAVEPFERALKENTPLTSISDPNALVEYLSQLNLKGDMVMDELKRVSAEKDELKKLCNTKDSELEKLKVELAEAKSQVSSSTPEAKERHSSEGDHAQTSAEKVLSGDEQERKGSEELFSFDSEVQDDSAAQTHEMEILKAELESLRSELSIAKETSADLTEKLEKASTELSRSRDHSAVKKSLEAQLEARNTEIASLTERLHKSQSQLRDLESKVENEKTAQSSVAKDLKTKLAAADSRSKELESEVHKLAAVKTTLEGKISSLNTKIDSLQDSKVEDEKRIEGLDRKLKEAASAAATTVPSASATTAATPSATSTSSKKKNKKKKKGGAAATIAPVDTEAASTSELAPPSPAESTNAEALEAEITRLKDHISQKDELIEKLSKKRKTEEELREEVESMQENLLLIGQEHVEAKEKIKALEAEKAELLAKIAELEKEAEGAKSNSKAQAELDELQQEYEELKLKTITLNTDLAAAQELAQSRFKDLTELRGILQKAQPELKSLRQEAAALKTTKEELAKKNAEIRALEKKEKEIRMDLNRAQRLASDREAEIKTLNEKVSTETNNRLRLEDANRVAGRDLRRSEAEKIEISAREEKAMRELKQLRELQPKMRELQEQVEKLEQAKKLIKEEADLKAQQYTSAQGLLDSMRDQTTELTLQLREARAQAESLDEELVEVQRMLGERTREGETMRRLLADVDERADSKLRDMRSRMEAAVEERDRMEEESSALARRKTRETEELRQKIRDLEREVKSLSHEKDELEHREREWKRRRDELESVEQRADAEVAEARSAVSDLKTALDASERQVSEAEKQKSELRKLLEEVRQKHDRLARDLKMAQTKLSGSGAGGRASIDSMRSTASGANPAPGTADVMYLKTILLQFLEQKDNRLRAQLVPVLGKLLRFDQADEKKWLSVVQRMG